MRKFDYSFLNNGLLPASLVNLTSNISALKTMAGIRKEEYAQIFSETEGGAKVEYIKVQMRLRGSLQAMNVSPLLSIKTALL